MSFGERYVNKFLFDFEAGWTEDAIRDWADTNHYDITRVNNNITHYVTNSDHTSRPILMLYTPIEHRDVVNLHGYFIPRDEIDGVYGPEGWDLVSSVPEEIVI